MGGRGQLVNPDRGRHSVVVDDVGPDGRGRGHNAAHAPFRLPGVLPGERVEAGVVHVRRDGVHFGRLETVRAEADARVSVACPHFLVCGGCDFLHANMDWQRAWKRARVAAALNRPLSAVAPVIESPSNIRYRHWMKLVRGPNATLGSYAPRSHDVVDMTGCVVHAPAGERIIEAVREMIRRSAGIEFRYLLCRVSSADGRAVVTIVVRTDQRTTIAPLVEGLAARPEVGQVRLHVNDESGDGLLTAEADEVVYDDERPVEDRVGPIRQTLTGGAFTQVNPGAAGRLYAQVVADLRAEGLSVLDLYSGSGGIALSVLAAGARRVIAVEAHAGASAAARTAANASGWGDRLDTIASTVEAALDSVGESPAVVVNPPRKGMSAAVRQRLAQRRWERLVYVSCDPDTLARDIAELPGTVETIVPVDLFPQTRHVETVLTLRRA